MPSPFRLEEKRRPRGRGGSDNCLLTIFGIEKINNGLGVFNLTGWYKVAVASREVRKFGEVVCPDSAALHTRDHGRCAFFLAPKHFLRLAGPFLCATISSSLSGLHILLCGAFIILQYCPLWPAASWSTAVRTVPLQGSPHHVDCNSFGFIRSHLRWTE